MSEQEQIVALARAVQTLAAKLEPALREIEQRIEALEQRMTHIEASRAMTRGTMQGDFLP